MLNVGIVGYGNVGREVEIELKNNKNFNLIAIFDVKNAKNVVNYSKIKNYVGKIDLLFLCVGSKSDLQVVALDLIKDFCLIDCYDNHTELKNYVEQMDALSKQNKKVCLCAFGWDPGLFSFIRGLSSSLNLLPFTFWGKGISQGHTQAIKNISGVEDAIQFTVPNKHKIRKIKNGKVVGGNMHSRLCYVVAPRNMQTKIRHEIVTMPDYFLGYKTRVKFVSKKCLKRLKTSAHCGEVITKGDVLNFKLKLASNPNFTAKVLCTFANCIQTKMEQQNYGAYTIFDVPLCEILNNKFLWL